MPSSLTRSAGAAGELVERDAERGGQALADVERGLLLAALVAVDLAQVDAGGARESGLGEAGLLAQPSQDLAEVGVLFAGFHGSRHHTPMAGDVSTTSARSTSAATPAEAARVAGYIAKYATKSTEDAGGVRTGSRHAHELRRPALPRPRAPADHERVALGRARERRRQAHAPLGASVRLRRALLHQEPSLLDDVQGAARGARRARCGHGAGRAAKSDHNLIRVSAWRLRRTAAIRAPGTRSWRRPATLERAEKRRGGASRAA